MVCSERRLMGRRDAHTLGRVLEELADLGADVGNRDLWTSLSVSHVPSGENVEVGEIADF